MREGGLQQIHPYESREPQPIAALIITQQKAGQDEGARKPANDHFHKVS